MSKVKIGINGFGRIGRIAFRIATENPNVKVVGINDLLDVEHLAYLLKYDSVHGQFKGSIDVKNGNLVINGNEIRVTAERNPEDLKWDAIETDVVLDCTGIFTTLDGSQKHIDAGAKKVAISAPSADAPMFVMGVNHQEITADHRIVSNASCTTNCLAPIAKVLNDSFGIKSGLMTTIHAYTNDQALAETTHKDFRRGRSATQNIIPTSTGAAKAVGMVLPELNGKLDGMAMRVPVPDGSVVDLVVELEKQVTIEEVNSAVKSAAENELKGILEYSSVPLVSTDILQNPHSSIYDASSTQLLNGNHIKVVCWYDNEWGYSNRIVDLVNTLVSNS